MLVVSELPVLGFDERDGDNGSRVGAGLPRVGRRLCPDRERGQND